MTDQAMDQLLQIRRNQRNAERVAIQSEVDESAEKLQARADAAKKDPTLYIEDNEI